MNERGFASAERRCSKADVATAAVSLAFQEWYEAHRKKRQLNVRRSCHSDSTLRWSLSSCVSLWSPVQTFQFVCRPNSMLYKTGVSVSKVRGSSLRVFVFALILHAFYFPMDRNHAELFFQIQARAQTSNSYSRMLTTHCIHNFMVDGCDSCCVLSLYVCEFILFLSCCIHLIVASHVYHRARIRALEFYGVKALAVRSSSGYCFLMVSRA